ncbi:MAG: hypothetical protein ACQETO_04605 [Pseudomonadota bacterium]
MLDTCICSFIIRERPFEVLQRLSDEVARHNRIVISAAGLLISRNDTAIAGHALASDCVLVSDNTREFARICDLPLENWVMR